jgi:excisionase family DNA binding protein
MDTLLTVEDVAKILSVAKITIYKWAENGIIPHYRLERAIRFREADINAFIEKSRVENEKKGH